MEYVLTTLLIQFVNQFFDNARAVYQRFNYLLNTPNSFRTVYNVYQRNEEAWSELYKDRAATYSQIVLKACKCRYPTRRKVSVRFRSLLRK